MKAAGFSHWTIIKSPLIMENLLPSKSATLFPAIAREKLFSALQPETILNRISPQDIGPFAAEAFAQPEKFNKKEFAIVGDKLTIPEIAETLSSVTGRKFEVKTITQEEATELGFHELSH